MIPYDFTRAVAAYCAVTGGSVSSWGRTRAHNARLGGVEHSAHLVWLAVDVVYDATPPHEEAEDYARRLGLRLIREADHDHLQPLAWAAG